MIFSIYSFLYPIVIFLLKIASPFHPKLSRFIRMRKKSEGKYPWEKVDIQDCILIHAASGEFEYAKPVIQELLKRKEKVLVTYYSPSYEKQIKEYPGIYSCPFPWDRPHIMKKFLSKIHPKAILITRTDLWYHFLKTAHGLKIPVYLFSATLNAKSSKVTNSWIRSYYQDLLQFVSRIYCVTFEDQKNIYEYFLHPNVEAIGDTRFDQALERVQAPKAIKDHLMYTNQQKLGLTLVAGSTWPEDEVKIFKAAKLLSPHSIKVAVAPHEPTPEHIRHLQKLAERVGLQSVLYSQAPSWPPGHILIIDKIGILADLYKWADWAFVGGSFKKQVHSVMEALAHGCLTFVGPFHINNREAVDFQKINIHIKGQTYQPVHTFMKSQELVDFVLKTKNTELLKELHSEIHGKVRQHAGASKVLADKILESISKRN